MSNYTIHVTPQVLRENARDIDARATSIDHALEQAMTQIEQAAAFNVFRGHLADALLARYHQTHPRMEMWAAILREFAKLLREAAEAFERADRGNDFSGLRDEVSGEGWSLVNNEGFQKDELLDQVGGSCTIYGIMNLLVQEGIDISQEEADAILAEMTRRYGRGDRFPLEAAELILDRYDVDYTLGSFAGNNGQVDSAAAEQFLIDNLDQGNSVYVWTETDDTFGVANSGHAYTVTGVQTDSNGKLMHVLVATNWDPPSDLQVIDADAFMDDWTNYGGYNARYITVP